VLNNLRVFLFQNQTLRQTVIKNTFWLLLGQGAGRLLRAAIVIYAARLLGAAGFGAFSYALGLAAFFTVLADMGLGGVLVRGMIQRPLARGRYFSATLIAKSVFVLLSFLVIVILGPLITQIPEALPLLPLAALILLFDSFRDFSLVLVRAKEKMEWEAAVTIFTNTAIAALGFLFLWLSPTSQALSWAYVLGSGSGLLVIFWPLRSYLQNLWADFEWGLAKKVIGEGWPLAVAGLLGGTMLNIDILMLGFWRPAAEVGFYAAAQKPIQIIYAFTATAATALFPAFGRLARQNQEHFRQVVNQVLWLTLIITFILAAGGLIFGNLIIQLLYGNNYNQAILIFKILAFTFLINCPLIIIFNALFAAGRQRIFLVSSAVAAASNIIFNALFIPFWGGAGAALSTVITQTIAAFFLWRWKKKIIG